MAASDVSLERTISHFVFLVGRFTSVTGPRGQRPGRRQCANCDIHLVGMASSFVRDAHRGTPLTASIIRSPSASHQPGFADRPTHQCCRRTKSRRPSFPSCECAPASVRQAERRQRLRNATTKPGACQAEDSYSLTPACVASLRQSARKRPLSASALTVRGWALLGFLR
jgi:hypothetical protein